SFAMAVPMFVDLQRFIVWKEIYNVKEVAMLRKGAILSLSHYIFTCPMSWSFLTKSEKYCASWLSAYYHGLQWEHGTIPYSMVKRLITMAVIGAEECDDNKALVYVKGREKREWLADIFDSDNLIIETLDADYKDIDSLHNLDVINTMRCGKHIKNCALQNVFKIHNWRAPVHRAGRILGRKYALTRTGYKFLEIGINVGPPSYVEIAIGDNRGNELILSIETWKGLYEQHWNIQNCLQNHCKGNSITVGPLTVRFSRLKMLKLYAWNHPTYV
ncbi:hypothetical protein ALC57_13340, partial [Trachymyrmex cornetzi]